MNLQASRPSPAPSPPVQPAARPYRRPSLAPAQALADVLAALAAGAGAYWFRFHVYPRYIPGGEIPDAGRYLLGVLVAAASLLAVFTLMGVYRNRRGRQFIDEFFQVLGAMLVTAVLVLAAMGVASSGPHSFTYSRLTYLYWLLLATALVAACRYGLRRWAGRAKHRARFADRALVIGHGAAADLVITRARMFPDYGYQLVGVVSDLLGPGDEFHGVPVVGRTGELRDLILRERVAVVFVALADVSQDRVLALMDSSADTGAEFRIVPSMLEILTTQVTGDQLDGIPLLQLRHGIDVNGPAAAVKRAFDAALAGLALLVLAPLLLILALLVRFTSPGPVLIRQERLGMHERPFAMLKFRTMRDDAEAESGPVWAAPRDPRRTAVGVAMRRFSLDELPQLWNILRGEMSFVGPRAERPVFVREFTARLPHYVDRHRVRPGLTGWAQANDLRGQTPIEERLIYDLYYIENWSLAFDLKILLITLFRVFTHKNAY